MCPPEDPDQLSPSFPSAKIPDWQSPWSSENPHQPLWRRSHNEEAYYHQYSAPAHSNVTQLSDSLFNIPSSGIVDQYNFAIPISNRSESPSTSTSLQTAPQSCTSSSSVADVLHCASCTATFAGVYRAGNYGRHRRQKHDVRAKEWVCEASGCGQVFQRSDARLKHQRRRHPELFQHEVA